MLIDYHLHNHFSPDSDADTAEILLNEKKRGVKEVCFTNHAEWFDKKQGDCEGRFELGEAARRFESVAWEIAQNQEHFSDLPIKLGAELTYNPKHLKDIGKLASEIPFDFLLCSVHVIDGFVIPTDGPRGADGYCEGKDETTTYGKYFEQLLEMTEWGGFDAIGHFDVVKKYGHKHYGAFRPEKYEKIIRKILTAAKKNRIGIELNARSMHERCAELFPHPRILEWAVETGVEYFTLGSDAHKAADAGTHLEEAREIAKKAGIKAIVTYDKRTPLLNPL